MQQVQVLHLICKICLKTSDMNMNFYFYEMHELFLYSFYNLSDKIFQDVQLTVLGKVR